MTDGPASDETAKRLAAFIDLLDAVTLPEQAQAAMALRIEAKAAQRALLSHALFAATAEDSDRAARLAESHLSGCQGLLLG